MRSGLDYLAAVRSGSLPAGELAECLRAFELAESVQTLARANMLAAFAAQEAYADDGQAGPRSWLAWQTRITRSAAAGAWAWVRRLGAHPLVAEALAAGELSASWARQVCDWSDKLPADLRDDADQILLGAAAGGAGLGELAALAEEMHRRSVPDADDDGFADRSLQLDVHWRGAGRLTGDLTPECAAALAAVLDALGKRAGPEDDRNKQQRQHDALEEACRRLIGAGCLPDRAGQSTQVQLHVTLDQLLDLTRETGSERRAPAGSDGAGSDGAGSDGAGSDGAGSDGAGPDGAGPGSAGPPGSRDDSGTGSSLAGPGGDWTGPGGNGAVGFSATRFSAARPGTGPGRADPAGIAQTAAGAGEPGWLQDPAAARAYSCDAQITPIVIGHPDPDALTRLTATIAASVAAGTTAERLRDTVLRYATEVLSGPTGLAASLRDQALGHRFPSVSLPLDVGTATDQIPPHLRRAAITRDRHCAFPGCSQPPPACHVHHIIPRSRGGPTALPNLMLLCSYHHLVAIHRRGWTITLHADGTTTAVSPDGHRELHSHSPPTATAA